MSPEPIKFLLVDDTPENLVALEALLRRDGLEILKARSGFEALELLLVHEIALAFLDVQMPEMNGFELAELMRGAERTKHVPIIFVTAGTRDPQRIFKGYESGAVDFLFKPIDPHILKSKADVFFELYRQRLELANALKLNEMFVGILGHDLRNPLGAVLTGAQILESDLREERHLRTLRRMTSAGQRMMDMIGQLLDLTRVRLAGGLGFVRSRKRLDMGKLVRQAVEEEQSSHPAREIIVETQGDLVTFGDPDRLLQLLSNLVSNAVHHSSHSSSVVVRAEGDDVEVKIVVSNGGAIPSEILPTLFDPFRVRRVTSSKSSGLGLGLFISQQIALSHGGTVTVDSSQEGGTHFAVRIPRRALDRLPSPLGRPRKVLIVEDDENIRDSLREAFEEEGYATATASNGHEALIVLNAAEQPDVVILDLVLPVLDGSRLYQIMQSTPTLAQIPVVVSTSNPTRAPAGVLVVPKPLKLERLLDTVADLWRDGKVS